MEGRPEEHDASRGSHDPGNLVKKPIVSVGLRALVLTGCGQAAPGDEAQAGDTPTATPSYGAGAADVLDAVESDVGRGRCRAGGEGAGQGVLRHGGLRCHLHVEVALNTNPAPRAPHVVTYRVEGLEGEQVHTLTIEPDGSVSQFERPGSIDADAELVAVVTDVLSQ